MLIGCRYPTHVGNRFLDSSEFSQYTNTRIAVTGEKKVYTYHHKWCKACRRKDYHKQKRKLARAHHYSHRVPTSHP